MFRPIHLLPKPINPDFDKSLKYKERWEKEYGKKCYDFIINKIKEGGGEDFLQWDFQQGHDLKHIMESEGDLKGIKIWELDIDFPKTDNFEAIDFSYAEFWHSKFKNATFLSTYFGFSEFYNFEFEKCLFSFTNFYGVRFEKVNFKNSTFVEHNSFNNCEFIDCEFDNFFTQKNLFTDCLFDANTQVKNLSFEPIHKFQVKLENNNLPNIYKGIKDSYLSGQVFDKYREYFFEQKKTETRYLKKGIQQIGNYLLENLTGYGVRPSATLSFMLMIIFIFSILYSFKYSFSRSLVISFTAFTTMGEAPGVSPYNFLYALESGVGICLFALLITVLANIWFSEK